MKTIALLDSACYVHQTRSYYPIAITVSTADFIYDMLWSRHPGNRFPYTTTKHGYVNVYLSMEKSQNSLLPNLTMIRQCSYWHGTVFNHGSQWALLGWSTFLMRIVKKMCFRFAVLQSHINSAIEMQLGLWELKTTHKRNNLEFHQSCSGCWFAVKP